MKTRIGTFAFLIFLQLSCVQKEHSKKVTFMVDMNQAESLQSVGLRGQFTSPPWQITIPMTDENNDGIYEVSITQATAQSQVEFKFVKNNNEFELKNLPNREIHFEYKPEKLIYEALFDNENGSQKIR